MKYPHFDSLSQLVTDRFVTARAHPHYPLTIYNYTVKAQMTPLSAWTEPMKDCRGLILDSTGEVVARPFQKFWNMSQVLDQIPADDQFTVWEKLDGSLGIVCSYAGERIVATRGSFESDQAVWFKRWLDGKHAGFMPSGETWLFEIVYPGNRIVVDYGERKEGVLLAVMSPDGHDITSLIGNSRGFTMARRFDGIKDFAIINSDPQFAGDEGFVVKWASGFMAKVKADEYCRLHRLITQCSTRTIWELLKTGAGIQELIDRVPEEFKVWVESTARDLNEVFESISVNAMHLFGCATSDRFPTRKDFAIWAKEQTNSSLLFLLLDGKDIADACWKLAEPKWATPFRKDIDA